MAEKSGPPPTASDDGRTTTESTADGKVTTKVSDDGRTTTRTYESKSKPSKHGVHVASDGQTTTVAAGNTGTARMERVKTRFKWGLGGWALGGLGTYLTVLGIGSMKSCSDTNALTEDVSPSGHVRVDTREHMQESVSKFASPEMSKKVAEQWFALSAMKPEETGGKLVAFVVNDESKTDKAKVVVGSMMPSSFGTLSATLCYQNEDGRAMTFKMGTDKEAGVLVPDNMLPASAAKGCEATLGDSKVVSRETVGAKPKPLQAGGI